MSEKRLELARRLINDRPGGLILTRRDETTDSVIVDSLIRSKLHLGVADESIFLDDLHSPITWSAEFDVWAKDGKKNLVPFFYMNRELGVRILFPFDKDEQLVISMDNKYKLPTRFAYRQIGSNGDLFLDEVHIKVADYGYISYQFDGERFSFIPAGKEKKILELTKGKTETVGQETTVKIFEIEEESGQINLTIEVQMPGEEMQRLTFKTQYSLPKLDAVDCPDQFELSKPLSAYDCLILNHNLIKWHNSILMDYIRQHRGL